VGEGITPLTLGTAEKIYCLLICLFTSPVASRHLPSPFLPPTPRVSANNVHIERISQVRILTFPLCVFSLTWPQVEVSFMRAWEGAFCSVRSIVIT